MSALWRVILVLLLSRAADASSPLQTPPASPVAFVNVSVLRIDRGEVEPRQTVVTSGGRIVAVGAHNEIRVPEGATVVDGAGRYLTPGLTDAHVHLATDMPWAPARPDFGDGALYLAHGVTTVINLRGSLGQLEWKRRVEAGDLVGPTIYTAGEFVNEPRVTTPGEVAREISAQHRAGYDLIKFHEVWTRERGFLTTVGLSREAYLEMNEAARRLGMPLVGHAPVNLGLDALLLARQPLAHLGMLSNVYFLPLASNRGWLIATAAAFGTMIVLAVLGASAAGVRRWRGDIPPESPLNARRARRLAAVASLAALVAVVSWTLFMPGSPLFDSVALRLLFTLAVVMLAAAAASALVITLRNWRDARTSPLSRWRTALMSVAGLVLAVGCVLFWLPVAWRSTTTGIQRIAERVRDAGISVQTTLVAYEALVASNESTVAQDPAIDALRSDTRALWRRIAAARRPPPGYRYTEFMKKVAGALHRAGVPLLAGTDAMGAPLVTPGSSLHRELQLLVESGLTRFEAIRAATVAPAAFLGKTDEFGTIEVGKRADLLLVEGNPLEDISRLGRPAGVMARGRWFPRERLDEMLEALRREPSTARLSATRRPDVRRQGPVAGSPQGAAERPHR